ncbi:hypothetical protein CAPTEDRAFT_207384 [Capitella teleta]|uniref:Receptor ligand binding region domain-containing protein n=1 Tax=Capitella teleta TaxID=283909 RepID=R7ULA8_CAPTE|nr:hypothetical protein CAPTEDRAFT_207384 [Capitella teleta]|eukprot:ELU04583.1 hypothetical protein CAPTEDRAFT_207384 [Capitella teleta]
MTVVDMSRGIFDQQAQKLAFKLGVEYVNENHVIGDNARLEYLLNETRLVSSADSVRVGCHYAEMGIAAFIGPLSSTVTKAVSSVSEALRIPQIAPIATNPMLSMHSHQFPLYL